MSGTTAKRITLLTPVSLPFFKEPPSAYVDLAFLNWGAELCEASGTSCLSRVQS